eukprot:1185099-Prorocentrum_minimum.AAC.1
MSERRVEEDSAAATSFKFKTFQRATSVAARAYNEEHPNRPPPHGGGGDVRGGEMPPLAE